MREHDRAAHHLVRMLRVDTEPHRNLNRLVKFGEFHFLQQRDGVLQLIRTRFHRLPRFRDVFPCFLHDFSVSHRSSLL